MTRRMKAAPRDAIRAEEDAKEETEEEKDVERAPVFPKTDKGMVIGYQYHPPRKTLRQKLREIVRILKG